MKTESWILKRIQIAVDEHVQWCEEEMDEALSNADPTKLWKLISQAAEKKGCSVS